MYLPTRLEQIGMNPAGHKEATHTHTFTRCPMLFFYKQRLALKAQLRQFIHCTRLIVETEHIKGENTF